LLALYQAWFGTGLASHLLLLAKYL